MRKQCVPGASPFFARTGDEVTRLPRTPIVKGKGCASRWAPTFTTSLFQRQKPSGVRAQESQQGTSDTGKNEPEWRKYIENDS